MACPEDPPASASSTPSGDETKFRDLLDRLPQTVFEFDLQGRFVYVNRSGLERFGYSESELAQGISVLATVVPAERDHLQANIARRLGGGETEGFQYTALRKDGTTFPALVHTTVVTKDGRPCGVQGYLIDISERVRAEAALRRRVDLEQLIMRASTRLVAELAPSELDARIGDALAEIGSFLNVQLRLSPFARQRVHRQHTRMGCGWNFGGAAQPAPHSRRRCVPLVRERNPATARGAGRRGG